MKPAPVPHDPLDDLIAAALHGDLTPEERAQFQSRLGTDPNAQAAYQEAQAMNDLLEQTHRTAQPDPGFEQRMVSGVRRKLANPPHQETAWESLLILWKAVLAVLRFPGRLLGGASVWTYSGIVSLLIVAAFTFLIYQGNQTRSVFTTISDKPAVAGTPMDEDVEQKQKTLQAQLDDLRTDTFRRRNVGQVIDKQGEEYAEQAKNGRTLSGYVDTNYTEQFAGRNAQTSSDLDASALASVSHKSDGDYVAPATAQTTPMGGTVRGQFLPPAQTEVADNQSDTAAALPSIPMATMAPVPPDAAADQEVQQHQPAVFTGLAKLQPDNNVPPAPKPAAAPAPADSRKLIRNAQLDLEVKSYQSAFDQITALTKSAGGYVDTSSSQRGGNGKLQGTVVVKILPENLDAFLLKLRDLGDVQNQSVSTDDVTKDYFDTQARLVNSQKMEEQLQDLLKRENGKVSDLLAVERELGRVRGEIEQMQGQLKLYDFQVQYATVTMNLAEKDLNQAAAYLLKEQDNFSLFATDVEGTFQKARAAADQFNAQVLAANLEHVVNSDNNQVAASLVVMVPPEQIEPFLAQIRGLGRVANFTRQTERVAKDGGDSSQPADETKTEKDKVRVELSIRSDDDSRKQVALTVVAKNVSDALDQAKAASLANAGTEILASSLNSSPDGSSNGQLSVRVPGKEYTALMASFRALGRNASLSIQRNDNNGPGANGDDVPVIVTLALTDNDAPVQETNLTISADDVDTQAQQIKKEASDAGVEIKASSFERQPDGTELAQMTLRLPLGNYPAFLATLQKAGKTESLSVQRDDRPNQARPDDAAPAEIQLQVHNTPEIVPDNNGLWATLRDTFSQGFGALFASVRVIGVIVAFLIPWVIAIIVIAWAGRRIYVWRKNR